MMLCANCGQEIIKYFRGNLFVWKHKSNRQRYCISTPMYTTKAEPETR